MDSLFNTVADAKAVANEFTLDDQLWCFKIVMSTVLSESLGLPATISLSTRY